MRCLSVFGGDRIPQFRKGTNYKVVEKFNILYISCICICYLTFRNLNYITLFTILFQGFRVLFQGFREVYNINSLTLLNTFEYII